MADALARLANLRREATATREAKARRAKAKAPQIAFVMEVCEQDMEKIGRTTVLGLLRTMERIGSVLGPIIAATLVGVFGYEQAIMFMGIIISGSAILFLAVFAMTARGSGAADSTGG